MLRPEGWLEERAARRLAAMHVNVVDEGAIAVKRNVHEVELAADAAAFRAALAEVLVEPGRRFGAIVVRRPAERVGRPFEVGDRFAACLCLGPLRITADHSEIAEVGDHRVVYRYLSGTPLAGESVYAIHPRGRDRCTLEVTFTWQERNVAAIPMIHLVGLAIHDAAVLAQAEAAAQRIGGRVLATTVRTRRRRAGSPRATSARASA